MADLSLLIKPSSSLCNLRCSYCFYYDEAKNRETESYGFMKEEILEEVIKKAAQYCKGTCNIVFQGGEPTLRGLDFFKEVVRLQKKYETKEVKFTNGIQTNGTKLTKDWISFLKENHFLVGISLDGIEFTHDMFRKDASGKGTFEQVVKAIKMLEEEGVDYNILTVVTSTVVKKISHIYSFYKEMGFEYLQFIPCLNPLGKEEEKYEYSLTPQGYGKFLKSLFDLWYQDLERGKVVHIQLFEEYIRMLFRQPPGLCGMAGFCTPQHIIEADGEVYPCDFYVLDEYKLGNIARNSFEEINEVRSILGFIEESLEIPKKCEACKYYPLCRGGCKRYRKEHHMLCKAYYEFFEYTIRRLEKAAVIYQKLYGIA